MSKKPTIFKRLRHIYKKNPLLFWSIVWITVMPSLGSLLSLNLLFTSFGGQNIPAPLHLSTGALFILSGAILMGLAFIPTTLLTAIAGFLWGWVAFPLLVVAYMLASAVGYVLGLLMSKDALSLLLAQYPKAHRLVEERRSKMGRLVFFVRLSPVIPFALSNVLFALLKTGMKKVILYGLLGMLPRASLVFASGVFAETIYAAVDGKDSSYELWAIGVLLVASLIGILIFFRDKSKDTNPSIDS